MNFCLTKKKNCHDRFDLISKIKSLLLFIFDDNWSMQSLIYEEKKEELSNFSIKNLILKKRESKQTRNDDRLNWNSLEL